MDQVQEIKNKLNIVDVVREYVPRMKQSGTNWKTLCPFHNEKTPSFMVSEDKQIFHCFGCGEGGDVFEFVKKIENVDFPEALRMLAQKAGVVLKKQDPKLLDLKSRLLDIQTAAAKFFAAHLWQTNAGKPALDYLRQRGLQDQTIKGWRLGWAPESFDALTKHLQQQGFAGHEINQSGVVGVKERGGTYDRFRGRIMFPLFDAHGQTVGFTGRLLKEKADQGKYVNSPQTPIYNKSYVLYGLWQGKEEIKKRHRAVLVEGQMDVLQAHQAGFTNVVASSGTALTTEQLDLLGRFSQELVFAFDADNAGAKAIIRSTDAAMAKGFNIRVLVLPTGEDPDSFIRQEASRWPVAVDDSPELMEYFFSLHLQEGDIASLSGKRQAADALLKLIAKLPSPIDRDFYIQKLASSVQIAEGALREALRKVGSGGGAAASDNIEQLVRELDVRQRLAQRFLGWLLARSSLWPAGVEKILPEMVSGQDERELYSELIVYYTDNNSEWNDDALQGERLTAMLTLSESQKKLLAALQLLADDLRQTDTDKEVEKDWQQVIVSLQRSYYRDRLQQLQSELRAAETKNDTSRLETLTTEINQLLTRLAKLQ